MGELQHLHSLIHVTSLSPNSQYKKRNSWNQPGIRYGIHGPGITQTSIQFTIISYGSAVLLAVHELISSGPPKLAKCLQFVKK